MVNPTTTTPTTSSCSILWSTQSGRAKACARRTKRILKEQTTLEIDGVGCSFDETPEAFVSWASNLPKESFLIMFVSTTGDGEHCDSIRDTWKTLLQKSLPRNLFEKQRFALFCLGDRAYGPQFCAGGRKLAVRLLQLGMTRFCDVGYGDDNTPNGGVFRDLDGWLEEQLLPRLEPREPNSTTGMLQIPDNLIQVQAHDAQRWEKPENEKPFLDYFSTSCPISAYAYDGESRRIKGSELTKDKTLPLTGTIVTNDRITADDWEQETRHIHIEVSRPYQSNGSQASEVVTEPLPYRAGDVAAILPFNSNSEVERFLNVLPESIQAMVDQPLRIEIDESSKDISVTRWPEICTLRQWLKYCADIHSLPEREDLRALSPFCSLQHDLGKDQSEMLLNLSETSKAALYADYVLREKRSWTEVFYDFESLRAPGSSLTLESLMFLLPPIRPREFSIASAPSTRVLEQRSDGKRTGFSLELCVAVVRGQTRLGRKYHGLCSEFLSRLAQTNGSGPPQVKVWVRPGTFARLPLELKDDLNFAVPIMCVGAGTGVAPMRSLLLERDAIRSMASTGNESATYNEHDNILVFGCRKQHADYYYKDEWQSMSGDKRIRVLTAFSRDQYHKIYVQRVVREADGGELIVKHLLERGGALYIAGGPQMARAVKEEVVEALGKELPGGDKEATQFLARLQRVGRFSVEAWN